MREPPSSSTTCRRTPGGKAQRVFTVPTPEQWRATLPGHNSIAWCVWHAAHGKDWSIAALRGDAKILTRDGWVALRGYVDAVYAETRRFVQDFDFDTLDRRCYSAPRTIGPWPAPVAV